MAAFGYLMAIGLCVLFSAFFSGAETGIISLNRIKLESRVSANKRNAVWLKDFLRKPEIFLSTTLIGNNLCLVAASSLATSWAMTRFSDKGPLAAIVFLTPVILIFGEIIPKSIFRRHSDSLVNFIAPALKLSFWLLHPLVKIINFFPRLFSDRWGGEGTRKSPYVTKEELKFLIEQGARDGVMEPGERNMIYRIFDFNKTTSRDIMIPLDKAAAFEANTSLAQIKRSAGERKFSRYPVYFQKKDNITGILNIYDILYNRDENKTELRDFLRPALVISENEPIDLLLARLRKEGQVMAVVVNKPGRPLGVITIEDIVEEIVGEI